MHASSLSRYLQREGSLISSLSPKPLLIGTGDKTNRRNEALMRCLWNAPVESAASLRGGEDSTQEAGE